MNIMIKSSPSLDSLPTTSNPLCLDWQLDNFQPLPMTARAPWRAFNTVDYETLARELQKTSNTVELARRMKRSCASIAHHRKVLDWAIKRQKRSIGDNKTEEDQVEGGNERTDRNNNSNDNNADDDNIYNGDGENCYSDYDTDDDNNYDMEKNTIISMDSLGQFYPRRLKHPSQRTAMRMMIIHALATSPQNEGSYISLAPIIEKQFHDQLNRDPAPGAKCYAVYMSQLSNFLSMEKREKVSFFVPTGDRCRRSKVYRLTSEGLKAWHMDLQGRWIDRRRKGAKWEFQEEIMSTEDIDISKQVEEIHPFAFKSSYREPQIVSQSEETTSTYSNQSHFSSLSSSSSLSSLLSPLPPPSSSSSFLPLPMTIPNSYANPPLWKRPPLLFIEPSNLGFDTSSVFLLPDQAMTSPERETMTLFDRQDAAQLFLHLAQSGEING